MNRPAFVDQTILYDPATREERGNCTEAAVASLLGIRLEDVPDFRANGLDQFWPSFHRFFRDRGFEAIMMHGTFAPDILYLASGISPRGVHHMVLMRCGLLVHDPHPSKAGIAGPECIWLLAPVDPAAKFDVYTGGRITTLSLSAQILAPNEDHKA
ncbi:hypothetical protein [Allomesorhizobium alhagi]|uniref:Uncharacterized protein n=1 Tax=Mesorhizobium alhagi CCNWXJ12-2 TaxID=1107882 RepID=H0HNJ2_9HYPH|nr:hypothetical protein [Mesorhizobium alhagi]EHK57645.1 hypothetical protein MAXJ12_08574 [Mesorhizobium alhagi CCNWXJ12-2]